MTTIQLTPYQTINGLEDDEVLIKIKKADFTNVTFRDGTTTFPFFSCYFNRVIIENDEEIDFNNISLGFFNSYIKEIKIEKILETNISVDFFGSIVSGKIESSNLRYVGFNNCLLNNYVFIINIEMVRVTFTKENIKLHEWRKLITHLNLYYKELIEVKQSYYIYDCKNLQLSSNFESHNKRKKFNLNLSLKFGENVTDRKTTVMNAYLDSFSISGSSQGKISIENVKISDWYIYDFLPKNEVSFYNINPMLTASEPKIGIHKSDLTNVWFDNVYFNDYERISLFRSKLSTATFTSCNFPATYSTFERFMPIDNVHYPDRKTANPHKDLYEIFLQLKKSLESTGNYYEAQKLQAIAHDALKRVASITWSDKKILGINSLSNDHALSIKRPFIGFLIFSISFYMLYLLSLHRIFNSNEIDLTLFKYYFSFIDLTHDNDFLVSKDHFTFFSLFLDYLNKIVNGFFIYQFISAFRKYGKK